MSASLSRRGFIGTAAASAAGACLGASATNANGAEQAATEQTAASAARPPRANVEWPVWDEVEERALLGVLNSGKWGRSSGGEQLKQFEATFGEAMQARYCLATSSGTTALLTALGALNIGPGDEVILPPYTFVATFNVITHNFALPVFVDSDLETFQIDPTKIEASITENTKLLLPVHIGGLPADMDGVNAVAAPRKIPVIEDACQAPLAEWRGQPVGTHGLGGCISFQASKNLTSGEGGAVLTNDEHFANLCYNFHSPGNVKPAPSWGRASNFRMTEFQAGLLLAQWTRVAEQFKQRETNAAYLTKLLEEIPGIHPARWTSGTTRSGWHLYMFRYDSSQFNDLPRAVFLRELGRAGVGASGGYSPLNNSPHVRALAENPHYVRIYGKKTMEDWVQRNECPVNDRLCEEAVWFTQTTLLRERSDMERIAEVVRDIQQRSGQLSRAQ